MPLDPYNILGVERNASQEEIKKAFRKLAHQHHPDKGGGDEQKFKEVSAAYQILSDPEKRRQYDQFGQTFDGHGPQGNPFAGGFGGFNGASFDFSNFGDLGDIMSEFFGGGGRREPRTSRGNDIQIDLQLSFEEMVRGVGREVTLRKLDACVDCKGTGAKDGHLKTCQKCGGQGAVRVAQRTVFGNVARTVACDVCHGRGQVPEKECFTCQGTGAVKRESTIKITLPPGMEDGEMVRVRGKGEAATYAGTSGDLYARLFIKKDRRFVRDGHDLRSMVDIGFTQAALGATVGVETIDGMQNVEIPAGTQSGEEVRIKGKGIGDARRRGDHIATVRVVTPRKLSKKQKQLLEELGL